MNLRLDGMHHYSTAEIASKWTAVNTGTAPGGGSATQWTVAAEGRTANCIKVIPLSASGSAQAGYLDCAPLMTPYGAWVPNNKGVCGFAIKVQDLQKLVTNAIQVKTFFAIYEGPGPIFKIQLAPNGTFSHYFWTEAAFDDGYVGASTQGLRSNTWAYIEFKWTVAHAPDGHWVTRMNNVVIFDMAGDYGTSFVANTSRRRVYGSSFTFGYSGVWNAIRTLQCPMTSITNTAMWMCDFYLADQATHSTDYTVHDFLGSGTIGAIYPNGAGDKAQWTPDGGGNNFDKVKERPPDEDTSTVSGTTPGIQDAHNMDNVPAGAVILAFQQLIRAKKTTPGTVIIDPVLRIGGVNYVSEGQGVNSTDAYEYVIQPYDGNPATGAQLTESEANGMQGSYIKES